MAAPTEGSDPRTIPQRWAEDGYVVVRQFFAGDELAAIAAQVGAPTIARRRFPDGTHVVQSSAAAGTTLAC